MAEEGLSATDQLALGLSRAYYAVCRALRLSKLRDLIGASINVEAPVSLLGRCYSCPPSASEAQQEEVLGRLLHHFQSILWMSYRTGFTPIPAGEAAVLKSDAGWGCTLRSGQMILAQGLQRHLLGPEWRWPVGAGGEAAAAGANGVSGAAAADVAPPPELARLLQLFWDTPAERNAFSLHNLCAHGRRCGVVPGRWLGPWVMCKAIEATAAAALMHHPDLGLTVAVLADAGGGAPLLVAGRFEGAFAAAADGGGSGGSQQAAQQLPNGDASRGEAADQAAAADAPAPPASSADGAPELVSVDSTMLEVTAPVPAAALAASVGQLGGRGAAAGAGGGGGGGGRRGLILLVPLVLGLGKLNPRYAPQLEAVISWPQSIGVVGGRPSSSLYFVGCQSAGATAGPAAAGASGGAAAGGPAVAGSGPASPAPSSAGGSPAGSPSRRPPRAQQQQQQEGQQPGEAGGGAHPASSSVIYLDPHQVQEAACSDGDWLTFHCETPRSMPLASIDPSLALGFYCGSLEEYRDLSERLAALEARSRGAPLVCVASEEAAAAAQGGYDSLHATEWVPDEMSSEEEEEDGEEEDEGEKVQAEESWHAAELDPRQHRQQQQGQQQGAAEAEEEPFEVELDDLRHLSRAGAAAGPLAMQAVQEEQAAEAAPGGGPSGSAESGGSEPALPPAVPGQPVMRRVSPRRQQQQQPAGGLSPRQMSRGWELL